MRERAGVGRAAAAVEQRHLAEQRARPEDRDRPTPGRRCALAAIATRPENTTNSWVAGSPLAKIRSPRRYFTSAARSRSCSSNSGGSAPKRSVLSSTAATDRVRAVARSLPARPGSTRRGDPGVNRADRLRRRSARRWEGRVRRRRPSVRRCCSAPRPGSGSARDLRQRDAERARRWSAASPATSAAGCSAGSSTARSAWSSAGSTPCRPRRSWPAPSARSPAPAWRVIFVLPIALVLPSEVAHPGRRSGRVGDGLARLPHRRPQEREGARDARAVDATARARAGVRRARRLPRRLVGRDGRAAAPARARRHPRRRPARAALRARRGAGIRRLARRDAPPRAHRGLETLETLRDEGSLRVYVLDDEVPETTSRSTPSSSRSRSGCSCACSRTTVRSRATPRCKACATCNLRRLAHEISPVVMPGDFVRVALTREGKEPGQGVGHLDDGSMVVVNGGVGSRRRSRGAAAGDVDRADERRPLVFAALEPSGARLATRP